jgi:hypothetical protein
MDHLHSIPKPRRFSLIVDRLVETTHLTKALIDGASGVNLMFLNTFKGLGLTRDQLRSSPHPFYRVVLGKHFVPLVQVTLSITFGDASNYCTEMLTFEVADFSRPYHVILRRSCYIKFMAIPWYAYLKLKMIIRSLSLGLHGDDTSGYRYLELEVGIAGSVSLVGQKNEGNQKGDGEDSYHGEEDQISTRNQAFHEGEL